MFSLKFNNKKQDSHLNHSKIFKKSQLILIIIFLIGKTYN